MVLVSFRRQSLITKFISSKTSGIYLLSIQYIPLNLSPVLREIMFKVLISPEPLKKPAALVKVGAAVIAEAAKAPRINLLERLLFSTFSKTKYSLTFSQFLLANEFSGGYCTKQHNKKALIFRKTECNPMN